MTATWVKFASLVLAFSLLPAAQSEAAQRKRVPGQYATSAQPYWQVGQLNSQLSVACQRGEFLQKDILRLSIGYTGQRGRAVTGVATSSWNLYDPKRMAEPRKTFHFFNQGFSDCKVYVADQPRRPRGATAR